MCSCAIKCWSRCLVQTDNHRHDVDASNGLRQPFAFPHCGRDAGRRGRRSRWGHAGPGSTRGLEDCRVVGWWGWWSWWHRGCGGLRDSSRCPDWFGECGGGMACRRFAVLCSDRHAVRRANRLHSGHQRRRVTWRRCKHVDGHEDRLCYAHAALTRQGIASGLRSVWPLAHSCQRLRFTSANALVPRAMEFCFASTTALSKPRTPVAAAANRARFPDDTALRACATDGRCCSCCCWHGHRVQTHEARKRKSQSVSEHSAANSGLTFAGIHPFEPTVIHVPISSTSAGLVPSTVWSATTGSTGFLERAALWAYKYSYDCNWGGE